MDIVDLPPADAPVDSTILFCDVHFRADTRVRCPHSLPVSTSPAFDLLWRKKMARLHAPEFLILYNFTFGRFYICVLRSVVSRPCALSLFVERSRFLSHVGSVWSVVSRPSARSLNLPTSG